MILTRNSSNLDTHVKAAFTLVLKTVAALFRRVVAFPS